MKAASMLAVIGSVVERIDLVMPRLGAAVTSSDLAARDALVEARTTLAVVAAALTPQPDALSPLDRIREVLLDHEDDAELLDALRDLVGTADRRDHPTAGDVARDLFAEAGFPTDAELAAPWPTVDVEDFLHPCAMPTGEPQPTPGVNRLCALPPGHDGPHKGWPVYTPAPPPGVPSGAVVDDAGVVTVHHDGDPEPTEVLRPLPLEPVDDPGPQLLLPRELEGCGAPHPSRPSTTCLDRPGHDGPHASVGRTWDQGPEHDDEDRCPVWIGDEQCVNRADECRPGHHRLRPPDPAVLAQADDDDDEPEPDDQPPPALDRIVAALTEHGPLNNGQLAGHAGVPRAMVQPLIDYLRASGRVRRGSGHRWELVTTEGS